MNGYPLEWDTIKEMSSAEIRRMRELQIVSLRDAIAELDAMADQFARADDGAGADKCERLRDWARRTRSAITHGTPPLARSGLYSTAGSLERLELGMATVRGRLATLREAVG